MSRVLHINIVRKPLFYSLIFLFLAGLNFNVSAQNFKKIKPYNFMLGVHWNIVDDSGDRFGSIVDFANAWNLLPYPSSLNIDYYFMRGFSAEFLGSYNYYDSSKVINGFRDNAGHFLSLDLNAKYSLGFLMEQELFDPFVFLGAGYTGRESLWPQNMLGVNVGAGFNFMIYKGLGVQWRTTGKMGVFPNFLDVEDDYLQHHFGIIYKFPENLIKSNPFAQKKHGWIHSKPRYRKPRGR